MRLGRASSCLRWAAGGVVAIVAVAAHSQTLGDLTIQAQGEDVVARLGLNATVRYLQQTPIGPAGLYRFTFDLIAADEVVFSQATEESRRGAATAGAPEFMLVYTPIRGVRIKEMTLRLPREAPVRIRQGPNTRTIEIVFVGAAQKPATPSVESAPPAAPALPASAPASLEEVERRAAELMTSAKAALEGRNDELAINSLNQLLQLPPNAHSQEAQELIGVAWEHAGDERRARVEYDVYLRLYPTGAGADRVRQRLVALDGGAPAASETARPAATAADTGRRFTGNIAQYYFGGKARSRSLVNIAAGIDQSTLTTTTESAFVTSVDLGGRFAGTDSETRVVLRGSYSANLRSTSYNESLLSAAYVDYRRNESGLAVRIGRQSPISGGLLGFFDGVSLTYPIREGLKIDVMGGRPANAVVSAPDERLYAAVLEADNIFERWGGNVYVVDQTSEGITNRRAIGSEIRYSGETLSAYGLVDYETQFRSLNAISLQGSYQAPAQTTVTLVIDSRKAPSLQLTNALISSGAASLKTLLQMKSLEEVQADARATTAEAKQALVSVSRPISAKWQLTTDFRYSSIGALPAVGNFEATPATGPQYGATLQVTGSNLYSGRDINNFNLSVLSSRFFHGAQIAYNNLLGLYDNKLTLEPSIRLYVQKDDQGIRMYRITPGVRSSYRVSQRGSILGEGIVEYAKTNGPSSHDTTNSVSFYIGYRYEIF